MLNGKRNSTQTATTDAVIYCRVSSQKQVTEGNGLDSQEYRCHTFAKSKGYTVHKVFVEEGKSAANTLDGRPAMMKLMDFVASSKKPFIIIVDDLSRWSRDLRLHLDLRKLIENYRCQLESVSQRFGNDDFGKFMESFNVAFSEYERQNNRSRVLHRMESRIRRGECPWSRLPCGYKRVGTGNSKHIVKDEPAASIMADIFKGFADGRFQTQHQVIEWLHHEPRYLQVRHAKATLTWLKNVLRNPIYAGYLKYEKWGVELTKGSHEAIIGMDVFAAVQAKLDGRTKHKVYETKRPDFPLRGHIVCDDCGQPMTGSWCKGRTTKYSYYYCKNKNCNVKRKMQRTSDVHESFANLLGEITPRPQVLKLLKFIIKDAYQAKAEGAQTTQAAKASELSKLNDQMNKLLDEMLDKNNATIKDELRKRIESLQIKRDGLEQELKSGPRVPNIDMIISKAVAFISSPQAIWQNGNLEQKEMVLNLAFSDRLRFKAGAGFKTANISMPFSVLGGESPALVRDGGA